MKKFNYLILGAGVTGLSTAYHLPDQEYAIYEMQDRVGGMCRTERVDGFLFDYGEHFIRADDKYVQEILKKLLRNNLNHQTLNAAVYLKGHYVNYPFQTNLFGLPTDIVKNCLLGYVKAWYEKSDEPRNFEQWIYKTFGKGIAKHFMIPYNEKIWTVHPKDMTTDWLISESVIPKGDLKLVIEGALKRREKGKRIRWYPLDGGIESLPLSFLRFVSNLRLNKRAVELKPSDKEVVFDDGEVVRYKHLVNTIPLPELIKIASEVPLDVEKAARNLKYNSVLCVNLGIARKKISNRHWIYFPEREYIFARVYLPSNFSPHMVPKKRSSVSAIITYSDWKPISKENIIEKVIHDLIKTDILREDDKILVKSLIDIRYGFNIYTLDRSKNVGTIQDFLSRNNIHSIGRYGNWEYSGIDHTILNSQKFAESVRGAT